MTGPDRIWANVSVWSLDRPLAGEWSHCDVGSPDDAEYIRRDPAVLAALPEVQALIRQAVEAQQQRLLAWCDARQADVMGCLELTAQEEATAIGWIDNFRAAIRKRGEG